MILIVLKWLLSTKKKKRKRTLFSEGDNIVNNELLFITPTCCRAISAVVVSRVWPFEHSSLSWPTYRRVSCRKKENSSLFSPSACWPKSVSVLFIIDPERPHSCQATAVITPDHQRSQGETGVQLVKGNESQPGRRWNSREHTSHLDRVKGKNPPWMKWFTKLV